MQALLKGERLAGEIVTVAIQGFTEVALGHYRGQYFALDTHRTEDERAASSVATLLPAVHKQRLSD